MIGAGFAIAQGLGLAGQFASGIMSAQSRQAEFAEQLRRLRLQKEQTVGLATAKSGASGVEFTSASTQHYLTSLTSEFDRAISNVQRAGRTTNLTDMLGTFSNLLGGGAGMFGALGKANNWDFGGAGPGQTYSPGGGMPMFRNATPYSVWGP